MSRDDFRTIITAKSPTVSAEVKERVKLLGMLIDSLKLECLELEVCANVRRHETMAAGYEPSDLAPEEQKLRNAKKRLDEAIRLLTEVQNGKWKNTLLPAKERKHDNAPRFWRI